MGAPFKMKGSTFYGHGNQSPLKHEGFGPHKHAKGGSGSYEVNKDGSLGKQTGLGDTSVTKKDRTQLGAAGIQVAGDLLKLAMKPKPKHKFSNKMRAFTGMTFGKDRRGKGSATELT